MSIDKLRFHADVTDVFVHGWSPLAHPVTRVDRGFFWIDVPVYCIAWWLRTLPGWWQLKYFLFSPLLGEMESNFDEHIFQRG